MSNLGCFQVVKKRKLSQNRSTSFELSQKKVFVKKGPDGKILVTDRVLDLNYGSEEQTEKEEDDFLIREHTFRGDQVKELIGKSVKDYSSKNWPLSVNESEFDDFQTKFKQIEGLEKESTIQLDSELVRGVSGLEKISSYAEEV